MKNIIFNIKLTCIFTVQAYAIWLVNFVDYVISPYYNTILIMRALGALWSYIILFIIGSKFYDNDIRTYTYFLICFCLCMLTEFNYVSLTWNWLRILSGVINTMIYTFVN